ncbi:hypothetical protein [Streptomyces sp. NPDC057694]|uniref:hypothetical protein n=1 Tax=Streptomyces sp. NPDC057694 TaxID=3346216 RepID=UPI0036BE1851
MNDAPKKKTAQKKQFKAGGAALVKGLLSGADDVAGRSFIGGGAGLGASPSVAQPPDEPAAEPEVEPASPVLLPEQPHEPAPSANKPLSDAAQPKASVPQEPEEGFARTKTAVQVREPADQAEPKRPAARRSAPASQPAAPAPRRSKQANEESNAAPDVLPQRSSEVVWAHAAVHESFADAKMRSSQWKSYGFRLAPDVLVRLKQRLHDDRLSSGNRQLAIGHYLDAALRNVTGNVDRWIDQATDFATERLWESEATQPSSYRIGRTAHAWVSALNGELQQADFGRKGTLVVSAHVEAYLDALENEGPLQRPVRQR